MNTSAGAAFGAVTVTSAIRLDWISTTAASRATPSPIAGAAVRAAECGPARLASPIRAGPAVNRRPAPAALVAARPIRKSTTKAPATPPIMIAAASLVGAGATASQASAAAAVSPPTPPAPADHDRRGEVGWRGGDGEPGERRGGDQRADQLRPETDAAGQLLAEQGSRRGGPRPPERRQREGGRRQQAEQRRPGQRPRIDGEERGNRQLVLH